MKYDDAEYHFLEFETDLPQEAGGVHIGFYLAWLLLKGHGSEDAAAATEALRSRRASGVQVLFDYNDGAMLDEDFDERGNAFTAAYYEAHYFADFEAVFAGDFADTGHPSDDACSIPPTADNQARMSAMLDRRWAQWEAGEPFVPPTVASAPAAASANAPVAATPAPAPLPLARAPMPSMDALLDRMQDGLRRFLGFEAFLPDRVNDATDTPTSRGRGFLSEFPGGCHWVELVALREPVDDSVRCAMAVTVRSRLQALAKALAAIDIPGFGRAEPDDGDLYDTVYLWLPSWWGNGPLSCRDETGVYPGVYFRDESEIAPAIAHLARQAEGPLRKLLRQFETMAGLDAMFNVIPLFSSPAFLSTRMIQNVHLAVAMRNPRLHAICDDAERLSAQLPPSRDVDALHAYLRQVRERHPA